MTDHFQISLTDTAVDLHREKAPSRTTHVDVTSRLPDGTRVGVTVLSSPEDAPVDAEVSPREFVMDNNGTQRVDLDLGVGEAEGSAEVELRVQAYAVEAPQEQFTTSPPLTVSVNQSEEFPWWVLAVAGGLLVVIVVALGFVFDWFGGGGGDGQAVPDLVGATLQEVRTQLGEDPQVRVHRLGVSEDAEDAGVCVFLHTPPEGATATAIDVVVTGCPDQDVEIEPPTEGGALCSELPAYCDELITDTENTEQRNEVVAAQTQRWVDVWQVEGTSVPSVVGETLTDAENLVSAARLTPVTALANGLGTGGAACVLYQHPFDGEVVAIDSSVTLVLAECPAPKEDPADIEIVPAALAAPDDVCTALAAFCSDAEVSSEDLEERFIQYLETFRGAFSEHLVPELVGQRVCDARDLLQARELELEVFPPTTEDRELFFVTDQSIEPGVRARAVPDGTVDVAVQQNDPDPAPLILPDLRSQFELLTDACGRPIKFQPEVFDDPFFFDQ